jgi:exo-beta-1,3-glucanase (GH17 family)
VVSTVADVYNSSSSTESNSVSANGVGVPSFDSSKPFAIAYSPYTSSGGCKGVSAIASDLSIISAGGYQCIRLYGTDCNQVSNVLSALQSTGSTLKLFLGVFDLGSASSQTSALISALGGDWSRVITVSVGNEPVNQGLATPATVISTTSAVRSQLRAYTHIFTLLMIVLVTAVPLSQ